MTLQRKDELTLISNLATMLGAGIPLLEAVESLLEESKGAIRKVLVVLRDSLSEGHPLSHGLEKMPTIFDPVTINLIKAAEEAGTLETTLKDLTVSIKKNMAFSDKLRSSLTYPLFVLIIFISVLTFILAFVIPRIGKVFSGFSGELPPATKFLISASDALIAYYPYMLAATALVIAACVWLYKIRRRELIGLLLSLPGLQRLGRQIDLANFTRSMALMLGAGIPVAEALDFSETVVTKREVRRMIARIKEDVHAGRPMSKAMRAAKGIAPPMMTRIVETAELSGTLEGAMQELSDFFEIQVRRTLKAFATLLEPVMLVVMGLLVGGMMLAVIAPIYSLITQLNAG